MPKLYIIGGPNGAGKTTAALTILPSFLNCFEYINADSIANALSPFKPDSVSLKAGRLMLGRIDELIEAKTDFAFETTLASRSFSPLIQRTKAKDYKVTLVYFWLNSPSLAIQRVKTRVSQGGHNIPTETIIRRYKRSQINLLELYLPICDSWSIFDNSHDEPLLVAEGDDCETSIYNEQIWNSILK